MNSPGLIMDLSTGRMLFLLLCISSNVYSMEPSSLQAKRFDELVAVLPQLTVIEKWAMPKHLPVSFSSWVEQQKEFAYQAALISADPIASLKQVAEPYKFQALVEIIPERSKVLEGSGKQQYPLAHLARAFLLWQQGTYEEADKALNNVISAVGMYRSHEEPILCAALSTQLFLKNEHAASFKEVQRLQTLSKAYASFKPVALIQRQMLVDAQYLPALEQCSQESTPDSWQSLRAVALTGNMSTRCYVAQQQLASKNKKIRAEGNQAAQRIIQEYLKAESHELKACIEQFGVVASLEELAKNNNQGAAAVCAQWKCHQALAMDSNEALRPDAKKIYQQIKKYAMAGKTQDTCQPEQLDAIIRYADAFSAYHDNKLAQAAFACIEIMHSKSKNPMNRKMRMQAQECLAQLANKDQLDACCWHAQELIKKEGNRVSVETAEYCCTLAQRFFDQVPKAQLKDESGTRLIQVLAHVAVVGNPQASYLLSRCMLRAAHAGYEDTGLAIDQSEQLKLAFIQAGIAHKAGVVEAAPLVKSLMLYRGAQGLLLAKNYDLAVEQLLQLLDVKLPEVEKKLCTAFARCQLVEKVADRHVVAGIWNLAEVLKDKDQKECIRGLALCQKIFDTYLEFDPKERNTEWWQARLSPYQRFGIITQIERIALESTHDAQRAQACYVASNCYMLQARIDYQFLPNNKLSQELLLESSLSWARLAYQQSSQEISQEAAKLYREQLGAAQYDLACYFHEKYLASEVLDVNLKQADMNRATELLAEGSRLDHPGCIRALTGLALEKAHEGTKIDKKIFESQITNLIHAFELGDQAAGAILAEHYFDGISHPFACGYALVADALRAKKLAVEIGPIFPVLQRILGYVGFLEAGLPHKKNDKIPDIKSFVHLVMESALGGQDRAYAHLEEMYLSPLCTPELSTNITDFITNQANKRNPAALCALGSLLLKGTKQLIHVDESIKYFEEAVRVSNGEYGHYELVKVFVHLECNGVRDVFKAAQHCVCMLDANKKKYGDLLAYSNDHSTVVAKVFEMLTMFNGAEQEKLQAQELYKVLQNKLKVAGIQVEFRSKTSGKTFIAQAKLEVFGIGQDDDYAQNVDKVNGAIGEISDALLKKIVNNPKSIANLQVTATNGNTFSSYLLSKVYTQHALRGTDSSGKPLEPAQSYTDAAELAAQAFFGDTTNAEYKQQFAQTYINLFTYFNNNLIAQDSLKQSDLVDILETINQGLSFIPIASFDLTIANKMEKLGYEGIQALVIRGCLPAIKICEVNNIAGKEEKQ